MVTKEYESPDSTPPTTHNEHLAPPSLHVPREYRRTSSPGRAAYAEHGPLVDPNVPSEEIVQSEPDLLWSRARHFMREPFAEFWGVFILIMFGDGVVGRGKWLKERIAAPTHFFHPSLSRLYQKHKLTC